MMPRRSSLFPTPASTGCSARREASTISRRSLSPTWSCAIYDLTKWGPTTANCQPQRVLFVRSAEAKARLEPALSSQNKKKTLGAPVVAILAYDMRFYEHLPRLFHNPQARSWYETTPEAIRTTALRNATLQGAYLMLVRRAPSASTAARCRASRTTWSMPRSSRTAASSRISCAASAMATRRPCRPQDYRFNFDEVCEILERQVSLSVDRHDRRRA